MKKKITHQSLETKYKHCSIEVMVETKYKHCSIEVMVNSNGRRLNIRANFTRRKEVQAVHGGKRRGVKQ
jgi:hypothetical protein